MVTRSGSGAHGDAYLHYLDEAYGTLFGIDYVVESAVSA